MHEMRRTTIHGDLEAIICLQYSIQTYTLLRSTPRAIQSQRAPLLPAARHAYVGEGAVLVMCINWAHVAERTAGVTPRRSAPGRPAARRAASGAAAAAAPPAAPATRMKRRLRSAAIAPALPAHLHAARTPSGVHAAACVWRPRMACQPIRRSEPGKHHRGCIRLCLPK